MDDNRALTFTLETLRQENDRDHKEILSKLTTLCTKVAVTESKVMVLDKFREDHESDHEDSDKSRWAYIGALILLAFGVLGDWVLRR